MIYMQFVNSCLFFAAFPLWFWHVYRRLIEGASSARVVLYQKSLHWLRLTGLVLLLQRTFLVLSHWAKISLGASPDSGNSPPTSCPPCQILGCTSWQGFCLSAPNLLLNLSFHMVWGHGKYADLETSLLIGFASQPEAGAKPWARWLVCACGTGQSWKVVLT